jgi:opacity protein-like surface antigen
MKRTLSILTASLAFATTANANFYIGPKIRANYNVGEYTEGFSSYTVSSKGGAGAAFIGGLNFGYDYLMDSQIYVAIDGAILFNTLKNEVNRVKTATANMTVFLKSSLNYAIALQVGYQMPNKVTPYVSLGGYGGRYNMEIQNNASTAVGGVASNTAQSAKKTIFAFNPGLGVKYYMSDNLLTSIQYDYVAGGSVSKQLTDASNNQWTYSSKIRQHNVTLALLYSF